MADQVSHADRLAAEIATFKDQVNIHDLPKIFHYFSNKHLKPHVAEVFGTGAVQDIFCRELLASSEATGNPRIVSIGSGDGSVEIALAQKIVAMGRDDFLFECVELNPHLIERGRAAAEAAGLERRFIFTETDLSVWRPSRPFGAAFAHHSLHHIVALEHVFEQVAEKLEPNGVFVISDMIGRNGHMRWPETLAPLERLWATMPERYKYHHLFGRVVDPYLNWDCSDEGFEGIRAQDIMPALMQRFRFEKMCVWGGVLDVFIDRAYGHNLDPANAEDREFIDRVWAMDCALLRAGASTPTQIIATLTKTTPLQSSFGLTPNACVRRP